MCLITAISKLSRNWSAPNKLWLFTLQIFFDYSPFFCFEDQERQSRDSESPPFSLNSEFQATSFMYNSLLLFSSRWYCGPVKSLYASGFIRSKELQPMLCHLSWGIKVETRRMSLNTVLLHGLCCMRWPVCPREAGEGRGGKPYCHC